MRWRIMGKATGFIFFPPEMDGDGLGDSLIPPGKNLLIFVVRLLNPDCIYSLSFYTGFYLYLHF